MVCLPLAWCENVSKFCIETQISVTQMSMLAIDLSDLDDVSFCNQAEKGRFVTGSLQVLCKLNEVKDVKNEAHLLVGIARAEADLNRS